MPRFFPKFAMPTSDTVIIADGTSCRCQIKDGTAREAKHVAIILDEWMKATDNDKKG
jgi:Fe-S oxidoreductase